MLKRFRVERAFRSLFYWYGGIIARHPLYFVIIPLIVALGIGSGMLFLDTDADTDAEILYAPENSRASKDRALIDGIYSDVNGEILPQHLTSPGVYGQVIIKRKDGGNVLTRSVADEVLILDNTITTLTVEIDGENYSYFDLCMKWQSKCVPIGIINIFNSSALSSPDFSLSYPVAEVVTPSGSMPFFVAGEIAAVTFKDGSESEIIAAQAIQLTYNLNSSELGLLWEKEFLKTMSDFTSSNLDLFWISSASLQDELDSSTSDILGKFSIAFSILIMFTIITCSMTDWVRSKAWLASFGVFSAGLAIITSFGLLTYLGVPFVNVVGSTPFLVIGIGIDDMFLMVAAWRKTDVTKSTEHRMKEAFSEAAVSITITSITDALAFGIGAITPFYSIRIFCLYTGVAVVFDYLFQITFFAGCMALMGYREEKNLHVMTCRKVLPKDEAPSTAYRIFCAGGSNPNKTPKESDHEATQHVIMNFFRDKYGPFLTSIFVVPLVVLLYIAYLGASIWGMTQLVEGLTLSRLAPYGSYAADYYDVTQEYFSTYGPPVAIVVTEEVDYSDQFVWDELRSTLYVLEKSRYFHDCCSALWLDDYLSYLITVNGSRIRETSVTELFKGDNVRMFLQQPAYQKYSADIVFDNSTGNIVSSRFYVIPKDASTSNSQKDMMLEARKIVSRSSLPMIAYSNVFPYYEQYVAVLPNTIQNLGIAVGAMFVVSIVMLPNLLSSIFMCFSLASIIIGIIGFMSLWKVTLDLISMINLIVSIGFTVDFSAHIIYAYLTGPERTPRKSAIHALYTMGMPISQAAISTILAILILMTSDTYIFICFFKVMTLVMAFGALHGLVFLPVFLMILIHPDKKCCEVEQQGTAKEVETERGESNAGFHSDEPYIVRQDSAPYTISERDSQD
ncbi:patched domain-containing protein 3-like isoform X2 [Amphiura filiformis]|uniref:patched domain-containing protein 3-like isoform X2 n=1 Tax=Amphiura filiformis TaxID=82378 RepID=UPI003B20E130